MLAIVTDTLTKLFFTSLMAQNSIRPSKDSVVLIVFAIVFIATMAGLVIYSLFIQEKFNEEFFSPHKSLRKSGKKYKPNILDKTKPKIDWDESDEVLDINSFDDFQL